MPSNETQTVNPIGFFEETAGSLPDFPDREPPPIQPDREEIE